jgi:hypothetical protein
MILSPELSGQTKFGLQPFQNHLPSWREAIGAGNFADPAPANGFTVIRFAPAPL